MFYNLKALVIKPSYSAEHVIHPAYNVKITMIVGISGHMLLDIFHIEIFSILFTHLHVRALHF